MNYTNQAESRPPSESKTSYGEVVTQNELAIRFDGNKAKLKKAHKRERHDKTLQVYVPNGWDTSVHDDEYSTEVVPVLVQCPSVEFADQLWATISERHANREFHNRLTAFVWLIERLSTVFWDPAFSLSKCADIRKSVFKSSAVDAIVRDILADTNLFERLDVIVAREREAVERAKEQGGDFDSEPAPKPKVSPRGNYWNDPQGGYGRGTRMRPVGVTAIPVRKTAISRKNRVSEYSVANSNSKIKDPSKPFFTSFQPIYVLVRHSNLQFLHSRYVQTMDDSGYNDTGYWVLDSIKLSDTFINRECLSSLDCLFGVFCVERQQNELISKLESKLKREPTQDEIATYFAKSDFDPARYYALSATKFKLSLDVFDPESDLPPAYSKHGRIIHPLSSSSKYLRCLFDVYDGKSEELNLSPWLEVDLPAAYFQAAACLSGDTKAMAVLSDPNADLREQIRDVAETEFGFRYKAETWKKDLMTQCFFLDDIHGTPCFKAMRKLFPIMANWVLRVRGRHHYAGSILSDVLMRFEGNVMRAAILKCRNRGIPCISNNDGIFPAADRIEELRAIVEDAFYARAGYRIQAGIKVPPTDFLEWLLQNHRDKLSDELAQAIEGRLKLLAELWAKYESKPTVTTDKTNDHDATPTLETAA